MKYNIQKVALFLPRPTPFYMPLFFAMKRGLEQAGFKVSGWPMLLGRDELLEFCREVKPEVVFEMNRSRAQIPWLPKNIIHIGWIVDLLGFPQEHFHDSEILYFFEEERPKIYHKSSQNKFYSRNGNLVDWFPPGFSPEHYFHKPTIPIVDFSFVGHIPLPWSRDELNRELGNDITFSDFINCCQNKSNTREFYKYGEKTIARLLGKPIRVNDQRLRYDIHVRSHRILNRTLMMKNILSASDSINIFGPENWRSWDEFALYYKKFLNSPEEIRQASLSSKIGIHEGFGTHFRLFDIMGTGRCVFFHKNPFRDFTGTKKREIELLFEPNRHFVYFDDEDIKEKADFYLHNDRAREGLAREAYKLVHAKHKWSDRALKIKEDLQQIR